MAYQPKSYRKFLATSVSAAMVATTFGAVVPADVQQADAAESFSDVSNDYWASDSIQRLADEGIINGYQDGTYGPGEEINRGQVAELLANAFDLDVDQSASSSYEDLNDDSYYTPFAEAVTEAGYITGREDGTSFAAGMDLSREQLATILVRAFDLEAKEDSDATVGDLDEANSSHQDNIEILAQYEITDTEDGNFRPKETVNRAQFAVFLERALDIQEPLEIGNVSALTDDGHVLSVEFTRPYREELTASDIRISESASGERKGVQNVELSSDGTSAEITLYDNTSDDAAPEIERLVNYDIQVGELETTFARPAYYDNDDGAYVSAVDSDEREIEVSTDDEGTFTLEVPEDSDLNFQEVLGQELRIWFDADDVVVDYELQSEMKNGAIEVDGDEIELLNSGESYDLSDDAQMIVDYDSDDEETYDADEIEDELDGNEYDYAKVVLNEDGDVERVYANNFPADEDPILVEEVDEDYIIGYDGNELGLEDYVILKNGQEISIDDIEQDDLVFFNEDIYGDGLAVVQNTSESGEIDNYYEESFDFEGENYDYVTSSGYQAQYLNEDGDLEDLDSDGAEALQDGGSVTAYFNGRGELVLLRGDEGESTSSYSGAQPTENMVVYEDNQGNNRLEIEYVNQDGEEVLNDVAVDDLDEINVQTNEEEEEFETGNELPSDEDFEIDDFGVANSKDDDGNDATSEIFDFVANEDGADNTADVFSVNGEESLFEVSTDEDGNVEGLKFYEDSAVAELNEDIEEGDDFAETDAGSLRLNDDTVVFDTNGEEFPDADDVDAYTIEELNEDGIEIDSENTTVYFDDNQEVQQIAVGDLDAANTTDEMALIQRVDTNSDDEIVRIKALINGESQTLNVDDLDRDGLFEGSVVELEINDSNDEVESIDTSDNRLEAGIVQNVDVSDDEVTIEYANGDTATFELNGDGEVYDATDSDGDDFSSENLRDIDEGDALAIGLSASDSRFADAFAIVNESDLEDYGYDQDEDVPEITALSLPETVNADEAADVQNITVDTEEGATVAGTITDSEENTVDITFADDNADGTYETAETVNVSSLTDGELTVSVTAEDEAGNESDASTDTITLDTSNPVVDTTQDGSITIDDEGTVATSFDIVFSEELNSTAKTNVETALNSAITETTGSVSYTWDGATLTVGSENTDYDIELDGSTAITADLEDVNGNTTTGATIVTAD